MSYPAVEAPNILLHTVMLGHEVTHLEDHIHKISSDMISSGDVRIVKSAVRQEAKDRNISPIELFADTDMVLRAWLSELVADLIAVRRYGPAYFCSFVKISLALNIMDIFGDKHPSSRMRIRFMLDELRDLGYFKPSKDMNIIKNELQYWVGFVKSTCSIPTGGRYVAMRSIELARKRITKRVRIASRGTEFSAKHFNIEVPPLFEYLKNGIPPCEILDIKSRETNPASIAAILNTGNLYYLHGMAEIKEMVGVDSEDADIMTMIKVNQLLARAVETSCMFQDWRNGETVWRRQEKNG